MEKLTIELEENLRKAFLEYCKDNNYNPSAIIRMLLIKELRWRGIEIEKA